MMGEIVCPFCNILCQLSNSYEGEVCPNCGLEGLARYSNYSDELIPDDDTIGFDAILPDDDDE